MTVQTQNFPPDPHQRRLGREEHLALLGHQRELRAGEEAGPVGVSAHGCADLVAVMVVMVRVHVGDLVDVGARLCDEKTQEFRIEFLSQVRGVGALLQINVEQIRPDDVGAHLEQARGAGGGRGGGGRGCEPASLSHARRRCLRNGMEWKRGCRQLRGG